MAESNPPQDPFEIFRRLWGPLGLPVPGMAVPTLDPKEVEKRIAELRSVQSWLEVNLNMVRFAVQGLEMQRSALLAMGAGAPAGAERARRARRDERQRRRGRHDVALGRDAAGAGRQAAAGRAAAG
jgi:hypothetical protein